MKYLLTIITIAALSFGATARAAAPPDPVSHTDVVNASQKQQNANALNPSLAAFVLFERAPEILLPADRWRSVISLALMAVAACAYVAKRYRSLGRWIRYLKECARESWHLVLRFRLIGLALRSLFSGRPPGLCTANGLDQGIKATPTLATFRRFTSKAVWFPTGSIHGFELGNILMVNSSYGIETEKVPYATDGNNVTAMEETIMMSPVWTISGNQFHTRIRALLLMGTKNTDVTIGANAGSPQTITSAIPGGSYDLGVRGLTSFTSLTNVGATVTYVSGTDYEIDLVTGILRIIDGGAIATATTVVATYVSAALTREAYTLFNQQNQTGTLKCFGLRVGRTSPVEELIFSGNLTTESLGDADPKKHMDWKMKLSTNGLPTGYESAT